MSDAPRPLPPKKEVALALLEESSVFIHLDPRRASVVVPKWFTHQPQLVLQVGLNMPIPIVDLKVDDDGITCTLSFNRSPFWCSLPWSAVYALVGEDGRGMVWPDDVPPEVAQQMRKDQAAQPKAQPAKKPRARLAAVGDETTSPKIKGDEAEAAPKKRGRDEAKPAEKEVAKRPHIEAVPAPAPAQSAPRALRRIDGDGERADGASPSSPGRSPAPSPIRPVPPPASAGAKKPKRELPPYLRVIK